MKNYLLIVLAFLSISAFSQSYEVPASKKALLFKSTATWCAPCGFYHYVTDSIYNNNSDSILFLNGHVATSTVGDPYSGDMHNLLNAEPGNAGIPAYSIAGQQVDDWPPSYDALMGAANDFFNEALIANIAFDYEISENELTINTTTEFFQEAEGDFLVGAMVVENNIWLSQKVGDEYEDMFQHRIQRTVLGSLNTYSFGKLWADEIATGTVNAGTRIDHSLNRTLNPDWIYDELEIIVVIWLRPTGTEDHFALSCEDVSGTIYVGEKELVQNDIVMDIFPNPAKEYINIQLGNFKETSIQITNLSGQKILEFDAISKNTNVDVTGFDKGVYFITSRNKKTTITKRLVVN